MSGITSIYGAKNNADSTYSSFRFLPYTNRLLFQVASYDGLEKAGRFEIAGWEGVNLEKLTIMSADTSHTGTLTIGQLLTANAGLSSGGAITLTGDTANTSTIAFSRTTYNYITSPVGGDIGLQPGGLAKNSNVGYKFTASEFRPGTSNVYNLGLSTHKWKNVYATTFVGSLNGTAADSSKFGGMIPRYYLSAPSGDFTDFNGEHWNTIYEYRKGDGLSYDNDPLGQGWAAFISLRSNRGTDGLQFLAQYYAGTNKLLYRCKPRLSDVGQSNEWSEIANLNSNVASATKLKTSRKIWGQSFDGTGDIDGNITINGGIATYNSADECWEFSGKIKANDFVTNTSEVVVNQFKLTTTLNNSIINYQSDVVSSPFMAIIKPVPGFDLSNITITMGGEDISYANESNGVIIIPDVTGDINIVANSTVNTQSYVGDDNDITLDLPSGEYTLVYEDANGNQIDNFDEITTLNI